MAKPTDVPEWALDDDFATGPAPVVGTPTKVDPTALKNQGFVPGTAAAAQIMNWLLNRNGRWAKWLDGLFNDDGDDVEIKRSKLAIRSASPEIVGLNAVGSPALITVPNGLHVGSHFMPPLGFLPMGTQVFTSPGTHTWTRPAGCRAVKVTVIGAGAGGRSAAGGSSANSGSSGGGGAGGAAIKWITAPGASEPVVVGAGGGGGSNGGSSSFGSHVSASGGTVPQAGSFQQGGSGGVGSGGDINIPGGRGEDGYLSEGGVTYWLSSGNGGASLLHPGGVNAAALTDSSRDGSPGALGSGGSGGSYRKNSDSFSGGAGGDGVVIVEHFA